MANFNFTLLLSDMNFTKNWFCVTKGITLFARRPHALGQVCPTRGAFKVLVPPSDDFQFFGYNEDYEKEFREIAERNLGRKSINKRRF